MIGVPKYVDLKMHPITDCVSYPNWALLKRPPTLSDFSLAQRYRYLTFQPIDPDWYAKELPDGDPEYHGTRKKKKRRTDIRMQMIQSSRRKLIPEHHWEDLVEFAILQACLKWDPNRVPHCPLRNLAWRHLEWTALGYWTRNKHMIINSVQLSALPTDIDIND